MGTPVALPPVTMPHPSDAPLRGRTLVVVSNREPYEHVAAAHADAPPELRRPPGGLVAALDPTMRRTRGTWVAWGSGSADHDAADPDGRLGVPPEDPRYTLRRVWLDAADVDGYYHGFSNSVLWPLCHLLVQHYQYRAEAWDRYRAVNARFAHAAAEEAARAEGAPVVWVQDYHLALVPRLLRQRLAEIAPERARRLFVHHFWHVPFPPPDLLALLPPGVPTALLAGLLGNDLVAFHTERHAANFFDCVAAFVPDAEMRREHGYVRHAGRVTRVAALPISVDVDQLEALARDAEADAEQLRARHASDGRALVLSVDRIDYTKGIPERLQALDRLFEIAPELRGRVTCVLVATPSRAELPAYQALAAEIVDGVAALNARWRTEDGWEPVVLEHRCVSLAELAGLYRAADVALVSSLQDGMNLVAKEFVACQLEERGVLVLSRLAGAAEELDGAVPITPFDVDGFAAGIREALAMPEATRRARMRAMRAALRQATVYDWLDAVLGRVDTLAPAVGATAGAPAPGVPNSGIASAGC